MNLQNLVDFCQGAGLPSPFAEATVPAPLNIETCINAIMVRCGLLTPCYNDPDTFRKITGVWFERKQWTFEHLIKVIQAEYDPTENVFELRNEKTKYGHNETLTGGYKDTEGGKDTVALSGTDTEAHSGTDSTTLSGTDSRDISNTGTDTTTNTISAFNSSAYQPDNKSELLHGHTVDDDITYGKSESTTHGESIGTTYGKSEDTTYGHNLEREYKNQKQQEGGVDELIVSRHGNIGTVSAMALIQEELELLRHFDIYGFIAELFEEENMLMIY